MHAATSTLDHLNKKFEKKLILQNISRTKLCVLLNNQKDSLLLAWSHGRIKTNDACVTMRLLE